MPPRRARGSGAARLSFACSLFGLECTVYMVKVSYEQKPYRRSLMQVWGAEVIASPSTRTEAGRQDPRSRPRFARAASASRSAKRSRTPRRTRDTKYALGSVLNHVLLHQTVIGLEAKAQLELAGDYPDVVIGACGGGSNFGGLAFPFLADKFAGKEMRVVAVEPDGLPHAHQGPLRLRLRRHGQARLR